MIQINSIETEQVKYLISLVISAKYHLVKADLNNSLVAAAINALDKADELIPLIIDSLYVRDLDD